MNYDRLQKELHALIEDEPNFIANLSNIASCIFHSLPDLNWCGFYLWEKSSKQLVLGPFQGKPACIRIPLGKGVCGSSFEKKLTLCVDNVHDFPGHIACDSASKSELVIPLEFGVLDLDSPNLSRFSHNDADELSKIMQTLSKQLRHQ